jgi:transposase-like protein
MIVGFVDHLGGDAVETEATVSYKGFRFPAEIISHAVWLYHRFPLSYREVEELLLARGVVVSHETIRAWCDRFGPQYAAASPKPGTNGTSTRST